MYSVSALNNKTDGIIEAVENALNEALNVSGVSSQNNSSSGVSNSTSSASAVKYKDGSYQGSGIGYRGATTTVGNR